MKYSAEQLQRLILEAEDELRHLVPKQRSWEVPHLVMRKLGYEDYALAGPIETLFESILKLHKQLYRDEDVGAGAVHGGVHIFRGIVGIIYAPFVNGRGAIKPLDLNDFTELQRWWIAQSPADVDALLRDYGDMFDVAMARMPFADFPPTPKPAQHWVRNSAFNLQAAAASLRLAFDRAGAIQSAALAAELALKARLSADGFDESDLREKVRHDLRKAVDLIRKNHDDFEYDQCLGEIENIPGLVRNRYSGDQPDEIETGRAVQAAQRIAGSVARSFHNRSFYRDVSG